MSFCKKSLSLILATAIIFSVLLMPVSAAYENTYINTGDGATDILGVAATQVGYYDGGNNNTKYGSWYGLNYNPWCAMFVSWCANQAGISTEVIPKFASCSVGMKWFKDRGRWKSSDYTPKAGDLIFFEFNNNTSDGPDHVGIVRYTSGNTIYTIEGNTSNDKVEYKTRSKGSSVTGFAVPNYATKTVSTTGIYKVATTSSSLTIRSGAGTNYSSVGSIPKDTLINVLSISGSWGKVNYNGASGYVSMAYCSLVTPFIDFGDNFYAYIIQSEKWKHLENAGNNVQIAAGGNDAKAPRQIWQFKRQSDGSYAVMNCYNNSYLDNCESVAANGNNIQSWPEYHGGDNQRWYLTEGGFIVSKNGNAMVLDILGNNTSAGTNVQLYELNLTGAQKFSVYKLTNDGVQYQKPAKPDAPTLSVTSPVTVNTNTTFKWTASPLKSSAYDHRSYTVKVWTSNGSLILNKTGITETSLLVQYASTGTYTIQVIAVNDKYENYYTESSKATVVVQAAHTHSYSYKLTTSPTTSQTGVLTGTCSCSATTTVTLPKLDTTNYTYKVIKAATCTATGTGRYTWKTTTYGNYYFDVTLAKSAHNYSTKVTAPTCTAQGYTTHTCTACGDSYKDTYTSALGHNYSYQVASKPTNAVSGILKGTCSRCSGTTTVTLPKLNTTDYSYSVVKAATCTATGTGRYTWKTTTYGNFYFDVTIAKTAHNYTAAVTAPTCTTQGYTTHTCSACGDSYKDSYTAELGHAWDGGRVTTQPTETTQGVKIFYCMRCGTTRTESIPVLGHTHQYTEQVTAPTCTEKGYTIHICACGNSYVDRYVDALGHAWDGGKVTTPPTATENGVKTFICTRCGATRTESVPATGDQNDKPCDGGMDCPSGKFVDVNPKEWYHPYVDYAVLHGLFGGTGENTFEPETAMTRAMLVTVLWRYEGKPMGYLNTFSDVNAKDGSWYMDAVAWAAANGVVNGVGNGRFDPDGKITREQMATILFRYAQKKGIDTSKRGNLGDFPDANQVSSYAKDAVQWAVGEGIINGSDGKLLPQGSATRAQVATILMRYIENIVKK